jgi:cytochrome c556
MRKLLAIAAAVAVVLSLNSLAGPRVLAEPKADKDTTQALMLRKLKESQKVLEGIALNDFTKIAAGADELIDISKTAEWKVLKNAQYELFSNEFRRRADQMRSAARDKNIDGATLAYLELTMSCVRCHKYVREERKTELPTEKEWRASR